MIQLGVNTVLFKSFPFAEAARAIKLAGYDGLEISAIQGMCEHLDPLAYKAQASSIREAMAETGLKLLSTEVASLDETRLEHAFEAAAALGIPVVNVGPGGASGDEASLLESVERLQRMAERARSYGVTLCCKAHVGSAVFNTPTTLRAISAIPSTAFGVDMDPSHIHRAGENPAQALAAVISRTRHIHIRDCLGLGPAPGAPALQACGRGDIDLFAYFKAMVDGGYDGPVCLEVIGPEQDLQQATAIAAESYGYMNACLKVLKAR